MPTATDTYDPEPLGWVAALDGLDRLDDDCPCHLPDGPCPGHPADQADPPY